MSRVILSGGSSPLGDVLVPRLAAEHDVVAIARSDAAIGRLRVHGVEIVRHDLQAAEAFPSLAADVVVHAAGIGLAEALEPILQAVRPRHLIVISSASATVSGHPRREAVLAGERRLLAIVPDATILRPTMIYGSGRDRNVRHLWQKLHRWPVVPRVRGGGLLQPVLADDVAAAVAEVILRPLNAVLPVGGPVSVRFDELLEALALAMGKRRAGPALPISSVAGLLRHLPLSARAAAAGHAAEMLLTDRVVPPPSEVGFEFLSTPLATGMQTALARYRSLGTRSVLQ